jgi:uncharacterized membrane protein
MTASITFLLHLLGFGILFTTLLAGFILERKFRHETDFKLKSYTAGISKIIGLLSPLAALIILASGIGNIYYRHLGSTLTWYSEGWLVAKVILFVVLALNGVFNGPRLARGRLKILAAQADQSAPANADTIIRSINRQITLFYFVQTLLLLLVLCLSVFGAGKHS